MSLIKSALDERLYKDARLKEDRISSGGECRVKVSAA